MKKIILIVVAIVVILAIGIFAWLYFQNSSGSPQATELKSVGALPGVATGTGPMPLPASAQSSTVEIGTPSGIVTVDNFYKTATGRDEEYVTFASSPAYSLQYDTDNSSFVVTISAGPLTATRPAAEAALLNALGVSLADACKLNVTVGIEPSVDPAFANQALPLSFCK
jgi:hypothetical protein